MHWADPGRPWIQVTRIDESPRPPPAPSRRRAAEPVQISSCRLHSPRCWTQRSDSGNTRAAGRGNGPRGPCPGFGGRSRNCVRSWPVTDPRRCRRYGCAESAGTKVAGFGYVGGFDRELSKEALFTYQTLAALRGERPTFEVLPVDQPRQRPQLDVVAAHDEAEKEQSR